MKYSGYLTCHDTGASKVIITDINAARLELALTMGDFVTIDSSKQDLRQKIMEITNGNGIARFVDIKTLGSAFI